MRLADLKALLCRCSRIGIGVCLRSINLWVRVPPPVPLMPKTKKSFSGEEARTHLRSLIHGFFYSFFNYHWLNRLLWTSIPIWWVEPTRQTDRDMWLAAIDFYKINWGEVKNEFYVRVAEWQTRSAQTRLSNRVGSSPTLDTRHHMPPLFRKDRSGCPTPI